MESSEMETWTRSDWGSWKRWRYPALGLDAIANASPNVISLLVVATGPEDDERLVAAIRLARRLARGALKIVAGSVHPSARWLDAVRVAGADQALLVPPPSRCRLRDRPVLEDSVELTSEICPELHVTRGDEVTLSVCGRYHDRMVLARPHFERWCLKNKKDCPYWQGGPRG